MELRAREHVPELAGTLTALSLALVFGAVLGYLPASVLPRVETLLAAVPHLNAAISLVAIATILSGVRAIRRGNVRRHRTAMLASTALFAGFLLLYLYRVSIEGPTAFAGPAWVRGFVYLPLLAVHITLAIVCLPLVYYVLLLAWTHPVAELSGTLHPRVGRIAATLWFVSFSLGLVVYTLLHVLF